MIQEKEREGVIDIARNGHAYLISEDKSDDLFIHKTELNRALHGDKVKVNVVEDKSGKGIGVKGVVKEIVERAQITFSGVIEIEEGKNYGFVRTSGGKMPVDIYVPIEHLNGAQDGDVVNVQLHRWYKKDKSPRGIVSQVFGKSQTHEAEMGLIMSKHNIDYSFPNEVIAEAEAIPLEIPEKEILSRKDMRDVLTITIDPETAKDFDDAISFEMNPFDGIFEIGVHIADVAHYVRPGTELDKEAYTRATSVYLVDRTIPMLPERLSNGICSLRPNEDKLAFSVIFIIDMEGNVIKHSFKKTVINSNRRYTYEEAQAIIDGPPEEKGDPTLYDSGSIRVLEPEEGAVVWLNRIAKKLRAQRFKDGAVSFARREPQFVLDNNNKPVDVFFHESDEAHQLIEEFMLLANRYVATYAHGLNKPFVYRTHDLPDREKLEELAALVSAFGHELHISDSVAKTKESLNKLLKEVRGEGEEGMVSTLAIRSMAKAIYSTQIIGHYGLGFRHYSHFTSPIRRYPDLIAHRLLWEYINHKNGNVSKLSDQCDHCSDMENRAAKAQRESIKYKQCEYMSTKIGERFRGVVSGVTEFGIFVEIIENGCEGLVGKNALESSNLVLNLEKYCVYDNISGDVYRLGDEMEIEVNRVDMTRKQIDFNIVL